MAPQPSRLVADFVIDCTGLNTNIKAHSALNDLQQRYHLPLNPFGRLAVNDDFELEGLRHGDVRAFMAGVMAFGNHFAPVDSFAGLQFAAQCSLEALVRADAPGLRQLDGLTSVREWLRWARNQEPLAAGR